MLCAAAFLNVAVELVELHGPEGQPVFLNAEQVTTLRSPTRNDLRHYFPRHVNCVVVTTTGKFLATTESCRDIRDKLSAPSPGH